MRHERELHLSLSESRTPSSVRREVVLQANGESEKISILYEIFDTQVGDVVTLDGFVQCVLFHCMQRGRPLRIHGNLSESAARNLHEYQRAWALWRPALYHRVDLIPDAVVQETPRSRQAIQAFSCGVDATFTLLANKYLHQERGAYDIGAGLLVHGFDVSYDNVDDFRRLAERASKMLGHAGTKLKTIRTNSRAANIQSWLDSTSVQLSACLLQFSADYGIGLLSSSEPYDRLVLPTGTNPITDHLLSTDLMSMVHAGAGYSRTEKVEAIAKFPFFVEELKVCWQGSDQYKNCGRCEKCLRTRLNFAAAGFNEPSCFDDPFEPKMLWKLRARTHIQVVELEGIVTYLRRRGLSYPWVNALKRQIFLSRLAIPLEKALRWSELRAFLRSVFVRLGLKKRRGVEP